MGRARSVHHDADGERHGWRWRRREASRDSRSAQFSRRDIWECKYTYRTFAVARTWVVVESVNADIMASSSNNGAARAVARWDLGEWIRTCGVHWRYVHRHFGQLYTRRVCVLCVGGYF